MPSYCIIRKTDRAYFRKKKRLGIGRFLKKCPFWKKAFSWFESKSPEQFPVKGELDLHLPSWIIEVPFCHTKNVPFYWSEEPFDWFELNLINSPVYLNSFLIFIFFVWNIFTHILMRYMLYIKLLIVKIRN